VLLRDTARVVAVERSEGKARGGKAVRAAANTHEEIRTTQRRGETAKPKTTKEGELR
jgi:hypothetical protein